MGLNKVNPENLKFLAEHRSYEENEFRERLRLSYDRHTKLCVDISHQTVTCVDLGKGGMRVKLQVAQIKDVLDQIPRTAIEDYARDYLNMEKTERSGKRDESNFA